MPDDLFTILCMLSSVPAGEANTSSLHSSSSGPKGAGGRAAGGLRVPETRVAGDPCSIANAPGLESNDGGRFPLPFFIRVQLTNQRPVFYVGFFLRS